MANILDMIIAAKGGAPDPAEGADGDGGLAAQAAADADDAADISGSDGDVEDAGDSSSGEGDDGDEEMEQGSEDDGDGEGGGSGRGAIRARRNGEMQTLVFSATLTLPMSLRRRLRKGASRIVTDCSIRQSTTHRILGAISRPLSPDRGLQGIMSKDMRISADAP